MMATKNNKSEITATVRKHPLGGAGDAYYDEINGRVWSCRFDGTHFDNDPTEADVLNAWKAHRNWFRPGY